MVHATLGNVDEARRLFSEAITRCEASGLMPEAIHNRVNAATYLERLGDVDGALAYCREASVKAAELGMDGAVARTNEIINRHAQPGATDVTGGTQ